MGGPENIVPTTVYVSPEQSRSERVVPVRYNLFPEMGGLENVAEA
jgi:hypothetical protein